MSNTQPQLNPNTQTYNFNPHIIREYDIRGEVGKTLGNDDAYHLGLTFGTFVQGQSGNKICVGYDGRHSSPDLVQNLIKGLTETGMDVTNVGLGPTPMLYFAVKDSGADAGIMVTGSHNPGKDNGFKMTLQSKAVFGDTIKEIAKIAADGTYTYGEGSSREKDIQDLYIERLLKDLSGQKDMKIAWDAGNGATGEIMRRLTSKLPGEHILLFDDIDGDFPNHHPDPTVDKNLEDLKQTVLSENCDFGIAMDGDGDRIGVIDEKGTIIRSDLLLALYAKDVLETFPGAPIIGDIKCSQVLFDEITRLGGEAIMWKTGHSLIKSKMAETQSPLAGELSGHIFFADKYYGFDDALYCAIRLINAAQETDEPLSSLFAHLPAQINTPEMRIEVSEERKFAIVDEILERLKPQANDEFQISDLDGVRVLTPEGWWLLRASNTQSALVARIEAESDKALENLKNMLKAELAKSGYEGTL